MRVAVVGATGLVGAYFLSELAHCQLPIDALDALGRQAGVKVNFKDELIPVTSLDEYDFSICDLAFFALPAEASRLWAGRALAAGCDVIDNSSAFRADPDVPLVIPEVNADCLLSVPSPCLIANPNCSTIQLLVALEALRQRYCVQRLTVSSYQSVSGAGRAAVAALNHDSEKKDIKSSNKTYAFNVIPKIDDWTGNGFTKEEMKIRNETRRIWAAPDCQIAATAVRVPVRVGHAEAVTVECDQAIDLDGLIKAWEGDPAVSYHAGDAVITPLAHGAGLSTVQVSRVRLDLDDPKRLHLWVVADNMRKGAALNAVQIAECLYKKRGAAWRSINEITQGV